MAATAASSKTIETKSMSPADTVFRIGNFDRSSFGFADGIPSQPVNYVVGKSQAKKDWYATQPAELASPADPQKANIASAPRAITFDLDRVPASSYRLHVAVLIETGTVTPLPALRVSINGKHGRFYLHPVLNYYSGEPPQWGLYSADVSFVFPGSYLHQGSNTITLQAIEEVDKEVPGASLTYDAIELDQGAVGLHARTSSARILTTIFYQQKQGELDEIVDVFICHNRAMKPGSSADLMIAGKHHRQALEGNQDFGEEKLEFLVPEFPAKTRAQLTWSVDGHRQDSKESIDPQRKWTLFLVPHLHLDVGYSDYQAKVAAIQSRVIDETMDLTVQHPEFRFSLDGEWSLEQFLKTRTPAQQQRAITAIQKQQLFIPADYANLLTGFPTAETLIRSLYASANLSRVHGTPFNYATITDVPSYSWSYASILASAGIKSLLAGSNNYRAPVLAQGRLNENSPMWLQGPDAQKILFWYTLGYGQMEMQFGQPPLVAAGHDMVPLFLQQYERPSYRANATIIYGTQSENTDLFPQQAELVQQWNKTYAYPTLQYSGFEDALENIAEQFGNDIPTMRGDGGPYWEDGIAADAYYAAMERQNESRGPSAEKLATLTSLVNPNLVADKVGLDRMWTNMVLMDEHTWDSDTGESDPTSSQAVQQLAVKNSYAVTAHAMVDWVSRDSMTSLVDSISAGQGSLIVFNTLNWKRSGPVSLDLNKGDEIVDKSTGQIVPMEVLHSGNEFRHVRFIAEDVPPVGYKVFQMQPAEKQPAPAEAAQTGILESTYYRVTLDPATGAVGSIYDKQLGRELVDQQSLYRFGQYLYVSGGDESPNTILQYSRLFHQPKLQVHPTQDGRLVSVQRTPYGWVARMESATINTPAITSEVRLFDHEKKIELVENVEKKEVNTKEAVYFAFPFAMDHPRFQYEIQTGVVDPSRDMYPGAGLEWFSVQHWVSVEQDGISATVMPLDASLVTLGDINRGAWPTQFGQRRGTIFSYVMNNYWDTNYRGGQGGHFRFRYVITSDSSINSAQLSRMGWEETTPLEKDIVTSQDKALNVPRPLNGKQDGFLNIDDPDLLLEAWKPSEDGNGTILRFLDLRGETRTVTVQTSLLKLNQAWQTDAVERNQKPLSLQGTQGFQFTIHPYEIVTVRIVGEDLLPAPTH
jgi:hypothetical protein